MPDAPAPRIAPVAADERTEEVRQLLDGVRLPGSGPEVKDDNIFATLVRAPRLFRRWSAFGGVLLSGRLPARHREILVLRTAWNCHAPYEWGQHVRIGRRVGLDDAEMAELARADPAGFDRFERTLVEAADELHRAQRLSDATWDVLAARYGTEELIEVPMVVGHYHLVAMVLNGLQVEPDEGLEGFPPAR